MNKERPLLEIAHLCALRGGVTVLDIPELAVRNAEVLSLIGPNGAGKSTLLLILARLIPPASGTIRFRGQAVQNGSRVIDYRRKIAMVFQEPLLFDATVSDNVAAGLKIRGMTRGEMRTRVHESLEHFGITHLSGRHARKLSGGEAQRTSLARAFAVRPEIIFLDEPFSSLDPPTREDLIDDLQRILNQTQTTAVMATHDRIEALRLSSRIAVMKDGRIIQIGAPDAVMNHPLNEFVAAFVGVETILNGSVVRTGAGTVICRVQNTEIEAVGDARPGESVICCIRPEHVTLSTAASPEGGSARNTFAGRIVEIAPMGMFYKISLDCGFFLTAYVTIPSVENLTLHQGKSVFAAFKATAVHLIRK